MSDSKHTLDLEGYLTRIGYTGPRSPTFATLAALHEHHVRAIPFENLDILLGRGIRVDLPSIEQKLVHARRGGYCFEQNSLFAAVLRALGFQVTPHLGRVRWQLPPELETPRTHMVLRVETPDSGPCLADVGFGSMSLLRPIPLELDREQYGALEPRRLIAAGEPPRPDSNGFAPRHIVQQARLGDTWSDVYRFTLEPALAVDVEVGNWFTSTHPESRFVQNLIASRAADGCRHTLLNREFTTRYADGRAEKRPVDSPDQLLELLAQYFGLHFPSGTRFGKPGAAWPV